MIYRYIYKITCTAGTFKNKFYFGQHTTDNLNDGYKGSGVKLLKYYKKYPNDYIKEIVAFYNSKTELDKAEYDIIEPYLDTPMCLNMCEGGGGCHGYKHSEETKKRISEHSIGKKMSVESIEKNRISHLGRKLSEEHKKKISESNIGRPATMKDRHHSEETKNKISQKLKGRKSPMAGRIPWNKGVKISTLQH